MLFEDLTINIKELNKHTEKYLKACPKFFTAQELLIKEEKKANANKKT